MYLTFDICRLTPCFDPEMTGARIGLDERCNLYLCMRVSCTLHPPVRRHKIGTLLVMVECRSLREAAGCSVRVYDTGGNTVERDRTDPGTGKRASRGWWCGVVINCACDYGMERWEMLNCYLLLFHLSFCVFSSLPFPSVSG